MAKTPSRMQSLALILCGAMLLSVLSYAIGQRAQDRLHGPILRTSSEARFENSRLSVCENDDFEIEETPVLPDEEVTKADVLERSGEPAKITRLFHARVTSKHSSGFDRSPAWIVVRERILERRLLGGPVGTSPDPDPSELYMTATLGVIGADNETPTMFTGCASRQIWPDGRVVERIGTMSDRTITRKTVF